MKQTIRVQTPTTFRQVNRILEAYDLTDAQLDDAVITLKRGGIEIVVPDADLFNTARAAKNDGKKVEAEPTI